MKTLRRLIYVEIAWSVLFVLSAFLSLFLFFDLMDEVASVGRASVLDPSKVYTLGHAFVYLLLQVPSRVYELLPIAVLIGTVFVLTRLAQSSEFTILRTSGLGPWRALRTLLALGVACVLLTMALGDYVVPVADRHAQLLKAQFKGNISIGQTGAWLKEHQGEQQFSVNVRAMNSQGSLDGIRIFEFNQRGQLLGTVVAQHATITDNDTWQLQGVERQTFVLPMDGSAPKVARETLADWTWNSAIRPDMVAAALLKPERMRTIDLFAYIRHLEANKQNAQRYEIEFWRKLFYPMSCLVMVVLALPFAYLHFRSGGISGYVFVGVMIGISFFLLNNVFGYLGNLRGWTPWITAAAPAFIYSLLSLSAFGWLVLKR